MLHTTTTGSGPQLVILHGLFGSLDNWKMIATLLSEHYQVISVDLPNHGKSDSLTDCTYPSMAQQLDETLTKLEVQNTILLGHSMGGKVAMQLADLTPERIQKLIIVDIAPKVYPPHHQTIIAALQALDLSRVTSRNEADQFLERNGVETASTRQFLLRSLYRNVDNQFQWRFSLDILADNYLAIADAPTLANHYKNEVLFIKGQLSDYIVANDQPLIANHYPQAEGKIIAGAGHWPHVEKQRLFLTTLLGWLNKKTS